jgi:hypothetical protein
MLARLISVPVIGGLVAASFPLLYLAFLRLIPARFAEFDSKTLIYAAKFDGIAGLTVGTLCWIIGLSYAINHDPVCGLPRLSFPAELSRDSRDRVALSIFWQRCAGMTKIISTAYPWVFALAPGDASGGGGTQSQVPTSFLLLFLTVLVASSVAPGLIIERAVARRMVFARIYTSVYRMLWGDKRGPAARPNRAGLPFDPLGPRRANLAEIADDLSVLARRLDARQLRGFAPHPVSTMLRGSHRLIRQFLESRGSLKETIPESLGETLTMLLVVLSGPYDAAVYEHLDERISAFSPDGAPAVALIDKPPGRLAVLVDRALRSVQRINAVTISMAAAAAILLAVILAVLGKISYSALLGHLG